jgi:hypothetical protein
MVWNRFLKDNLKHNFGKTFWKLTELLCLEAEVVGPFLLCSNPLVYFSAYKVSSDIYLDMRNRIMLLTPRQMHQLCKIVTFLYHTQDL